MKVLFTIQHPAHVHLFRNAIRVLESNGHDTYVFAREKEINVELLNRYGIAHRVLAAEPDGPLQLPLTQLKYEWGIIRAARSVDPDVMVAMGEPAITHAGTLTDTPSLVFTDTEHATVQNALAFPFADRIYTPECYRDDVGEKQVRYPGYHELAYLHPNRFDPDPDVLDDLDVGPDERFVVLRSVSWDAMHDINDGGFADLTELVGALEDRGVAVLITAEGDLSPALAEHRISVDPTRIHHLLAFAELYVGESATMATESAVLGTPAVFVSSSRRSYTDELEQEYRLVFNFSGADRHERGLRRAVEILEDSDADTWQRRRQQLLSERIDTTAVILDAIRDAGDDGVDPAVRSRHSGERTTETG